MYREMRRQADVDIGGFTACLLFYIGACCDPIASGAASGASGDTTSDSSVRCGGTHRAFQFQVVAVEVLAPNIGQTQDEDHNSSDDFRCGRR